MVQQNHIQGSQDGPCRIIRFLIFSTTSEESLTWWDRKFFASGWRQMSTNSEVLSVAFLHETMVLFHVVSCRFSLGSIAFPVSLLDGGRQYLNCSWRVYCTVQSSQLEFYSLADISIKPLVDLGINKEVTAIRCSLRFHTQCSAFSTMMGLLSAFRTTRCFCRLSAISALRILRLRLPFGFDCLLTVQNTVSLFFFN